MLYVKIVDGYKSGESSFSCTVNSPPTTGLLEITPSTGIALSTQFQILCGNGWTDIHIPLSFKFMFRLENEQTWKILAEQSEKRSFSTNLPAGNVIVKAIVYDSKGASSETTQSVTVQLPSATDALSYLEMSTKGTVTLSSVSSALSVVQSLSNASPEEKKALAEASKAFVVKFFEQQSKEESVSSATSTSTTSTLSAISSVSSCASNLPDDTVQMVISKFYETMNSASSTSFITMTPEEIASTKSSADTLKTYVSSNLNSRSITGFSSNDLTKIEKVYNNLVKVEMKNVVADMPAIRSDGVSSNNYARLVSISTLASLSEKIKDGSLSGFILNSTIIGSISSLESVFVEMRVHQVNNNSLRAVTKAFDFVISSNSIPIPISSSQSIATLVLEKIAGLRMIRANVTNIICNSMNSDGSYVQSSTCYVQTIDSSSISISVKETGSYILTSVTTVEPPSTLTSTPKPEESIVSPMPVLNKPNLDYIALILLVIPVAALVLLVILAIYLAKKKHTPSNHFSGVNDIEMRSK